MKRFLTVAAVLALTAALGWSLDTSKLKPAGYVNDFAHKLDPASAQALEAYCANLERTTGVQMAIVLVDSLDDEPVEDVANRLYREWGVGKKGANEGLLILLSMKEHKSRVEVGYGLEPIVTDGFSGGVLRDIRPILRQGNYGGGLLAAAEEFGNQIAQAKGVALAQPQAVPRNFGYPAPLRTRIPFPLILIGFFILFAVLRGIGRGGGGTGFLTGMLLGNMMGGRGGWGGGGFGGYDSGGGGGGGFGGFGGGDSGGGGASGGW
ncbi:MAG TPA: TPM domain-containing protein [Bryobacteraceae bacterium]|nr:TPM domain-containing protein [Bryobacteraceae bacterium]